MNYLQKIYGYVYILTNTENGKVYIGKTNNFTRRIKEYSILHCKAQKYLYSAILKHGWSKFTSEIITTATCEKELNYLEIMYIAIYDSTNKDSGYNLHKGGDKGPSESAKKLISNKLKGRVFSEEHRKKISEANRRRVISDSEKNRLRYLRKGHKMSKESINKGVLKRIGSKRSEETKKKMSESSSKRERDSKTGLFKKGNQNG